MKTYVFEDTSGKMSDIMVKCDDDGVVVETDFTLPTSLPEGEDMTLDDVADYLLRPHKMWQMSEVRETAKSLGQNDDMEIGSLGSISKVDDDKRLVFGWAYVTHDKDGSVVIDKSGEFIDDPEVLEEAAYDFVIKSRIAGDTHQRDLVANNAVQVGTMVESMVFTPEKVQKMGIPKGVIPTGWWVGFRIDSDSVWKAVKEGKRPAFSIHGKARKEEVA